MNKLVSDNSLPSTHWKTYPAQSLGEYDNYDKAVAKLKRSEETDNLHSTDAETAKKERKIKAKKRPQSELESSEYDESDNDLSFPEIPVSLESNLSIPVATTPRTANKRNKTIFRTRSKSLSPEVNRKCTFQTSTHNLSAYSDYPENGACTPSAQQSNVSVFSMQQNAQHLSKRFVQDSSAGRHHEGARNSHEFFQQSPVLQQHQQSLSQNLISKPSTSSMGWHQQTTPRHFNDGSGHFDYSEQLEAIGETTRNLKTKLLDCLIK